MKTKVTESLLIPLLVIVFVVGGLGLERISVGYLGLTISIILVLLAFSKQNKLLLPRGFSFYSLFLIIFLASFLWSNENALSFYYFTLFLSALLFWLGSFNLKEFFAKNIQSIIVALGFIFGLLYLGYLIKSMPTVGFLSLYLPTSNNYNHNHIGDLWSLVLIIISSKFLLTRKKEYVLIFVLGVLFLLISHSRASYLSLAVGTLSLAYWQKGFEKNRLFFKSVLFLCALLFIIAGMSKTTIFSRPYFFQSLMGLIFYPLGVGVGNFGIISSDPMTHIWGMKDFSIVVHNIVLEFFSGLGFLGIVFLIWLLKVCRDVFLKAGKDNFLYPSLFFALLSNFLFDSTYFIPTMLWIWFILLGISQAD